MAKLQKGDKVVISYEKGYPLFTLQNRDIKPFDLNFESQTGLFHPVEYYEFIKGSKSSPEKNQKRYSESNEKYKLRLKSTIDSLKNQDSHA